MSDRRELMANEAPVADVVAYVIGSVGHAWCGWCRQWHRHGGAARLPEVRPSGCGTKRNEGCPTRGDAPVLVWPIPVAGEVRTSGDGYLGGKLPVSDEDPERFVTIVPARNAAMQIPRAAVKLMRATPDGCRTAAQTARFTWAERTGRIADVVLMRHDCKQGLVLRICYVDGKFESCYSNRSERIAGNKVRRAITECESDA